MTMAYDPLKDKYRIRDLINSYGGKYGIKDTDINWQRGTGNSGTGTVTLGGTPIANPENLQDGRSYTSDPDSIRSAVDQYAKDRGLRDYTKEYQSKYSQNLNKEYQAPKFENKYQGKIDDFANNAGRYEPDPFESQYKGKIDGILDDLLNAPDFEYDPETDQSFQAYKRQYGEAGDRSLANTMGEASGLTGGRLNSWAVSAGNQSKQLWDGRLMDRLPELEQVAYNRYQGGLANKRANINQMQGLDTEDYARYADDRNFTRGAYESDRDYIDRLSQDEYGRYADERNFDRANYESDRGFYQSMDDRDFQRFDQQRNFDRGNYESDRNFDRGTQESDRNFNEQKRLNDRDFDRGVLESDRNFEYQGTRDQIMDDRWMQQFNADEQQRIIQNAINNRQLSISEGNLALSRANSAYNQQRDRENTQYQRDRDAIMDDRYDREFNLKLQNEAKKSGADEQTLGSAYTSMMESGNPEQWLIENGPYLTNQELNGLYKFVPNNDSLRILDKLLGN